MSITDDILIPAPLTDDEQIALFTQVSQINAASVLLGSKVTNTAIIEPNFERLAAIATLLSANYQNPGAFAEYIINVFRKRNSLGHPIAVVRTGLVKEGLVKWSEDNPDLMRGWKKRDIAAFFEWEMTDRRIDGFVRALAKVCEEIGVKAGSDGRGGFRIYDMKQLMKKQNRRALQMQAINRKGEQDSKILAGRGVTPQGKLSLEPQVWEVLEDVNESDRGGPRTWDSISEGHK